ncbi:MAG: hypothetical protein KDB21_09725 [Acidimicrobiales bacterium]|nr:hypothetical protein [Acidimicrobiales bacterium]
MSIAVPLEELRDAIEQRGWFAFVAASGTDSRPRISHRALTWVEGTLQLEVGRGTALAVVAHPSVSVLWPDLDDQTYSLIVDGDGSVDWVDPDRPVLTIRPTWAVLHRSARTPPAQD